MRREAGGARCEVRGATSVFEFVCVLPQLLRRPETCLQCYYEDNEDSSPLQARFGASWTMAYQLSSIYDSLLVGGPG